MDEIHNYERLEDKNVKILFRRNFKFEVEIHGDNPKTEQKLARYEYVWSSPRNIDSWKYDNKNQCYKFLSRIIYVEEIEDTIHGPIYTSILLKTGEIINIPSTGELPKKANKSCFGFFP
jgi:hypothetical protein